MVVRALGTDDPEIEERLRMRRIDRQRFGILRQRLLYASGVPQRCAEGGADIDVCRIERERLALQPDRLLVTLRVVE